MREKGSKIETFKVMPESATVGRLHGDLYSVQANPNGVIFIKCGLRLSIA